MLTGTATINAIGNELGNILRGNSAANTIAGLDGNDLIAGGDGNDFLIGGSGLDAFVFDTAPNGSSNRDVIIGFVAADDAIRIAAALFPATGAAGVLAATAFWASSNGTANDADDRILYNTTTGAVLYDADGSGAGAAIEFARLASAPPITAADIVMF